MEGAVRVGSRGGREGGVPVRHVADHGEDAEAVGDRWGELDPRLLHHVARQRHRDRRAWRRTMLDEKLVRKAALAPHTRRQKPGWPVGPSRRASLETGRGLARPHRNE
eukprot:7173892-Prymnesium_polylepis.1